MERQPNAGIFMPLKLLFPDIADVSSGLLANWDLDQSPSYS